MTTKLTQTVQKGGCAAKISAETLRAVLGQIDFSSTDKNVLIDGKHFDDAGVYRISPEIALVQTLDFFTPIVDSPFLFGQIASANALSDVYAMGGTPKTAMAILAFPLATLDSGIMREVLEGAQSKVKEAECTILGGHSIDDETLKFGLSVTGLVHPDRIWSNQTAKAGDDLILTKAIGTGTLCAGLKNGDYQESDIGDAISSMTQLNRISDLLTLDELTGIHAATDITGFGLIGHALQLARASNLTLSLKLKTIPLFDQTLASLNSENLTRAHRSNRNYSELETRILGSPDQTSLLTLFDPQTSGGLLLSVDPTRSASLLHKIRSRFDRAEIIGKVKDHSESRVEIHD